MLIERLPLELLNQVLNFVDSVQDLAQCRLVCKHLDCLAERAMFKKPIVVPSASKAKALRHHLMRKEHLGKLITTLNFKYVRYNDTIDFIDLLPLVLTPAMESFTGYIERPAFYAHLVDFANTINTSFSHLKRLPSSVRSISSGKYYDALLLFRKTLQDVSITYYDEIPWNVYNRLDEFINLTALTMNGLISSVQDLDRMLAKCIHLQSLTLLLVGRAGISVMPKDTLLIWMNTHVEKVSPLNKVEFRGVEQPDLVEYLCYKYPNMKEANIFVPDIDFNQPSAFFWDP